MLKHEEHVDDYCQGRNETKTGLELTKENKRKVLIFSMAEIKALPVSKQSNRWKNCEEVRVKLHLPQEDY